MRIWIAVRRWLRARAKAAVLWLRTGEAEPVATRPARAAAMSANEVAVGSAPAISANLDAQTPTVPAASALPIYNFEHGVTGAPRTLRFGPYLLRIRDSEHTGKDVLKASDTRTFGSTVDESDRLVHTVESRPARPGTWAETAVVDAHPELSAPSRIFPQFPFLTGADDLALVLWFLTGREVAVGVGKLPRLPLTAADRLVGGYYFDIAVIDWSALPKLGTHGASDAVYAICLALAAPDLLFKSSLATSALDGLVTKWYSAAKRSRFNDLTKQRFTKATEAFKQAFTELGEVPEVVDDVVKRLPNLMQDSALAKLEAFLIEHGMLDAGDAVAADRVRLLNTHRNAIAHNARILINPKAPLEIELQIAGAVALVVLKIARVYIAKYLLGIREDYGVDQDQKYVRTFFATGRLHDQDVFTESHAAYLARVEAAWVERGELPD